MKPALSVLLASLTACSALTGGDGHGNGLPAGPCQLLEFEYQDAQYNMRIGPEIRGTFFINHIARGDTLAGWAGQSQEGVLGRRSPLDGPTSTSPLQFSVVVPTGDYNGTLKVHGDEVRFSFDDDHPGVAWMSVRPWRLEGSTMIADWGDLGTDRWTLKAKMAC